MIQITNQEKNTLAIVNHELRNPLAVIKLHAQLLEKTLEKHAKFSPGNLAAVIVKSIDCITSLLDQYLSVGKETANAASDPATFDLNGLIEEILQNFKALHPDHTFESKIAVKCPVKADRFKIGQVLINYLNNAIKFSPKNSTITVSLERSSTGFEVAVADQGIGIPNGHEHKIFERFYKLAAGRDEHSGSCGLGLFLVKEIIESYKGLVWAEKSKLQGSVFFFSLPPCRQIQQLKPETRFISRQMHQIA